MDTETTELEQVVALAQKLSAQDRVRLVEEVMVTLKDELKKEVKTKRSLYGLWSGVSISAEDIDEARREMWGNFPREDI